MSPRLRLLRSSFSRPLSRLALILMLVPLAMPMVIDGSRSAFAQEFAATPSVGYDAAGEETPAQPTDPQDDVTGPSAEPALTSPETSDEIPSSETDGMPLESAPLPPPTAPEEDSVSPGSERQEEPAEVDSAFADESGSVTITLTDQIGTPLQGILIERPPIFLIDSGGAWGFTDASGQLVLDPMPLVSIGFRFQPADLPAGCTVPASQDAMPTPATPDVYVHFVSVCADTPAVVTGSLTVQMMDQDSDPLVGGEFQLLRDGVVVETWTATGSVLILRDLSIDAPYDVHQVSASAGCVAAADQAFTLTLVNPSHAVAIINDCTAPASSGEVVIYKLDQYSTRRGGAEFQLIQDGTVVRRGVTLPLVGEVIFTGLSLDTPYTVNELEAPLGCIVGPDQTFTLTSEQPRQELIIRNECAGNSGSITITKTDQFGNVLSDVEFHILHPDGTLAGRGYTEADGTLSFSSLFPNVTYTVNEVAPPEGCIGADNSDVALTLDAPDQSLSVVNECEDAIPPPTPADPSETPSTIPTDPVSTPIVPPVIPGSTPMAASTPGASTTRIGTTNPGRAPSDLDGSTSETRASSIRTAANPVTSVPAVHALPNTGDGARSQDGDAQLALLAATGSLAMIGAGLRLRRL